MSKITIYKWITFKRVFTWKDAAGDPVPLDNKTITFYLNKGPADREILSLGTDEDPTALGSSLTKTGLGEFTLEITNEETADLTIANNYSAHLTTETDGVVRRLYGWTAEVKYP